MSLSLKIILNPWKLLVKAESGKRKQSVNISTVVTAKPLHVLPLCFYFSWQHLSIYPHSTLYKTQTQSLSYHLSRTLGAQHRATTSILFSGWLVILHRVHIPITFFEYVLQHRVPRFNNAYTLKQTTVDEMLQNTNDSSEAGKQVSI